MKAEKLALLNGVKIVEENKRIYCLGPFVFAISSTVC